MTKTLDIGVVLALFIAGTAPANDFGHPEGLRIYREQCASCHGSDGNGVPDKYKEPLVGDDSVEELARYIHKRMPEKETEKCRDADAEAVARYVFDAFYSPEAWQRNHPARIEFSRLTVRQFEESVADIAARFSGSRMPGAERGLRATYSNLEKMAKKKIFDRVDDAIDFQFGTAAPDQRLKPNEFAIDWNGSVIAEETGTYTFTVKTENGFQLFINDLRKPVIDAYVSIGGEAIDHHRSIRLLGGRAYPIRLAYFQRKDKTASVALKWKPPHGETMVIPTRNLARDQATPSLVVSTRFPPDDGSVGYPRGTSVSKAWDEAVTRAAIETATIVARHIDTLSKSKPEDPDRIAKLKTFCKRFAGYAFRRPLDEAQTRFFVDAHFRNGIAPDTSVKRVVMLALKSPRFLYPELQPDQPDDYTVAARLALGLWDSVPDEALARAAAEGRLRTPQQVEAHIRRMLNDPRTKAKVRAFFHHWLRMDEAEDIAKDTDLFPGFTHDVIADLRTSLDLFLDDVVWSEQPDYRRLLLADYMFMNKRLAEFYGAPPPAGGFEKVKFDADKRSGVLTHPYMLSTLAYNTTTSPIHRGVFLTRNLLGRTLHPPPKAVAFKESEFDPAMTMREKVAELTRPANCQTCHSVINPLGFSLEHFDAVGRFRTHDNQKPINAAGTYRTENGEPIELGGARDLASYAAESEAAQRGFIIQLFNQVAKQPIQAYGSDVLDELHESFGKSQFHIRNLLIEIAKRSALHRKENS